RGHATERVRHAVLEGRRTPDVPLALGRHLLAPEVHRLPGELRLALLVLPALRDGLLAVLLPVLQLLFVHLLGIRELRVRHRLGGLPDAEQQEQRRGEGPDHGEDDETPGEEPAQLHGEQSGHRRTPPSVAEPASRPVPACRPAAGCSRPCPAVRSRKTRSRSRPSGVSSLTYRPSCASSSVIRAGSSAPRTRSRPPSAFTRRPARVSTSA